MSDRELKVLEEALLEMGLGMVEEEHTWTFRERQLFQTAMKIIAKAKHGDSSTA